MAVINSRAVASFLSVIMPCSVTVAVAHLSSQQMGLLYVRSSAETLDTGSSVRGLILSAFDWYPVVSSGPLGSNGQ